MSQQKDYPVHDWMRLLREGASMAWIAEMIGISAERVAQILESRGLRTRPQLYRHSPKTVAAARRHWDRGLSASQIGCRMGVSKDVVCGIARRNGFTQRPSPIQNR